MIAAEPEVADRAVSSGARDRRSRRSAAHRERQEALDHQAAPREHNLKNIDVEFPLGMFTVVTGVSGSGKSTLVNDILYRALAREIYGSRAEPGAHDSIAGTRAHRQSHRDRPVAHRPHAALESGDLHRRVHADPRSLRDAAGIARARLQARPLQLQREGRPLRGLPGRRPEAHRDELPARRLRHLRRLPRPALQQRNAAGEVQGHVRSPTCWTPRSRTRSPLLENIPQIRAKLQTLNDVGLGYIHLGQSSTTLSGGEAQRIKLARELSKRQTGRTFYILDEPTTGLHFDDVRKLLDVLQRLVDLGNTVMVIEHHLDVIKTADWIIDLGPDGGEKGGAWSRPERRSRWCASGAVTLPKR